MGSALPWVTSECDVARMCGRACPSVCAVSANQQRDTAGGLGFMPRCARL